MQLYRSASISDQTKQSGSRDEPGLPPESSQNCLCDVCTAALRALLFLQKSLFGLWQGLIVSVVNSWLDKNLEWKQVERKDAFVLNRRVQLNRMLCWPLVVGWCESFCLTECVFVCVFEDVNVCVCGSDLACSGFVLESSSALFSQLCSWIHIFHKFQGRSLQLLSQKNQRFHGNF